MGDGFAPLRMSYELGDASVIDPQRMLLISGITLCVGLLTMAVLYVALVFLARAEERRASETRAAALVEQAQTRQSGEALRELSGTEAGDLFLARLAHLVAMAEHDDMLVDPTRGQLLRAALLSTYRDCRAAGAGPVARALLHASRRRRRDAGGPARLPRRTTRRL